MRFDNAKNCLVDSLEPGTWTGKASGSHGHDKLATRKLENLILLIAFETVYIVFVAARETPALNLSPATWPV